MADLINRIVPFDAALPDLPPADQLVRTLDLQPHPEGGWFRELHRGPAQVVHQDGRERSSGTLIYFLLDASRPSRWHVVDSDEYWSFVDGAPLELYEAHLQSESRASGTGHSTTTLGPPSIGAIGAHIIPAGVWQAARSTGPWSLVSCVVAPGFDFVDFRLLARDDPEFGHLSELPHTEDLFPPA